MKNNNGTLLRTGVLAGLAGGLAEIGVVWAHAGWTGGDASLVARQVSVAARVGDGSVGAGIAVHMILAVVLGMVLGMALVAVWRKGREGWVFPAMLGSLVAVWAVNFFVVLPVVSPGFVHLLPLGVTLGSKLAFGLAAATVLRMSGAVTGRVASGPVFAAANVG